MTMSKIPKSETFTIDGPGGRLEVLLEKPASGNARGSAVICHPHPLQEGTMQNKVVHTLARAFVARNILALRFNFRGVGQSEGRFDEGRGELQDALAVARSAEDRAPGAPLWFAGFSFGAAIAVRAAAEWDAAGLISVAPAVSPNPEHAVPQPSCPWLVIQGDQDEQVAIEDTIAWINGLDPGPELQIFESTGHFFHGKLVKLRNAAESFIGEHQ